jgi:shikimate kinase
LHSPVTEPVLPIALVGLPGGGKSTVGKHLARSLGRVFLDSDAVIEQRLGCSIRHFFANEGEAAFRAVEAEVIGELTLQAGSVLATGGGAVGLASNRLMLRSRCQVIYLRSSPEQLYRRLRFDTQRPLLQVPDPLAKLRSLHTQRDPLYLEVAHLVVETGAPSVPVLVRIILNRLGAQ